MHFVATIRRIVAQSNAFDNILLFVFRGSFNAVGQRVFNVNIEGTLLPDVDIVQQGGGVALRAITMSSVVTISDEFLTIQFLEKDPKVDNPKISGIEIVASGSGPSPPASAPIPAQVPARIPALVPVPIRAPLPVSPTGIVQPILINCGGSVYTDTQGRVWGADSYFTGGSTYRNTTSDILNTADDTIYQSERYGVFTYQIPIAIGTYQVIFHESEIL